MTRDAHPLPAVPALRRHRGQARSAHPMAPAVLGTVGLPSLSDALGVSGPERQRCLAQQRTRRR